MDSGEWVTVSCEQCGGGCKGKRVTKGKRYPVDGKKFKIYNKFPLPEPQDHWRLKGPHGLFACPKKGLIEE